jgi:hypothetical protein
MQLLPVLGKQFQCLSCQFVHINVYATLLFTNMSLNLRQIFRLFVKRFLNKFWKSVLLSYETATHHRVGEAASLRWRRNTAARCQWLDALAEKKAVAFLFTLPLSNKFIKSW